MMGENSKDEVTTTVEQEAMEAMAALEWMRRHLAPLGHVRINRHSLSSMFLFYDKAPDEFLKLVRWAQARLIDDARESIRSRV